MPLLRLVKVQNPRWGNTVLKLGLRSNGHLEDISDLEEAIHHIENGPLPSLNNHVIGYWVLRQFIDSPSTGDPELVSVVSSKRVFSLSAFREAGIDILSRSVDALETGNSLINGVGSDPDLGLSSEDLGVLLEAYRDDETSGYFTLTGVLH